MPACSNAIYTNFLYVFLVNNLLIFGTTLVLFSIRNLCSIIVKKSLMFTWNLNFQPQCIFWLMAHFSLVWFYFGGIHKPCERIFDIFDPLSMGLSWFFHREKKYGFFGQLPRKPWKTPPSIAFFLNFDHGGLTYSTPIPMWTFSVHMVYGCPLAEFFCEIPKSRESFLVRWFSWRNLFINFYGSLALIQKSC